MNEGEPLRRQKLRGLYGALRSQFQPQRASICAQDSMASRGKFRPRLWVLIAVGLFVSSSGSARGVMSEMDPTLRGVTIVPETDERCRRLSPPEAGVADWVRGLARRAPYVAKSGA